MVLCGCRYGLAAIEALRDVLRGRAQLDALITPAWLAGELEGMRLAPGSSEYQVGLFGGGLGWVGWGIEAGMTCCTTAAWRLVSAAASGGLASGVVV
jgi:hypothetical protein